ncbi:hypothetical protein ACJIZ3_005176 [Penstemon smallii]|uniref:Protein DETOXIFICATION n=1 Tax=Penstemon smallii TaxID=265156 RepID=A0ABD3S461_9LAMI
MEDNYKQPLLLPPDLQGPEDEEVPDLMAQKYSSAYRLSNLSFFTSFIADDQDISSIDSFPEFISAFKVESGKLWYLAGPAIFTSLCQYSLGAFTQTFAGHVGTLELAAFSIENSVIAGLSLGVMLGMGSAVETLCGQAFGAGQYDMLGIYLQRSWVILLGTAFLLMFLYIFAFPFLLLIGQTANISRAAGKFALWMIPQLFAYALNFPTAKFLQAQSKIMAMALISAVALVLHIFFSWLFMLKLGWGMAGGAAVLDASWWFVVVVQLIYVFSGTCDKAWPGFTMRAFRNLWGFVRFLETWYFMALVLFAGYLKNAEVAVAALSVCVNILGWTNTIACGFNAAISVRVSNELGASHPRTAKFSVVVMVISAFLIGLIVAIVLLIFQNQYPSLFTDSSEVKDVGIWYGMVAGTTVQMFTLFFLVHKTNWNKEASSATSRIKEWGGEPDFKENDNNSKQPLLSFKDQDEHEQHPAELTSQEYQYIHGFSNHSFASSFVDIEGGDIPPITGIKDFYKEFKKESIKLWYLAGPAIFTSLCQYSLGAITQTFAGHVGTLELAAFSIENTVIAGLSFGVMLGMGSALETLCGQAYGAGHIEMLGVYMQRSWVILLVTAFLLMFLYIFSLPFLLLIGQTHDISHAAGKFAIWMIPQLYAYAFNFPIAKFLQAQSKIMAMAWISAVALVLHVFFSWLLMLKLGWGMAGGALVLNISWWFIVVAQLVYIFSGTCGRAWSGFSWKAFQNLWGFVSVRISNELGAYHPRTAKFSVLVVVISAFLIGLIMSIVLLVFKNEYPSLFSNRVAIGAGWQALVAYVNIACYYLFGVPLGLILGYAINMGVKGIWYGMVAGTVVQTLILFWIVYKTNWIKEASVAAQRIRQWGGESNAKPNDHNRVFLFIYFSREKKKEKKHNRLFLNKEEEEEEQLLSVYDGHGLDRCEDDIGPINGINDFAKEFFIESKKLWYLAFPAIFTSFCQYGLITITQIFAGSLGTTQLAAVSVENSIISGFPFGMMFGLSSALETYCGQAYGANQFEMLGTYMQRSWVILNAMAIASVPLFVFATQVLKFLGQTASLSREAGNFALWMIPQQFAYASMLPSTKFLQAQSKVMPIAVIAAVALCLHAFVSWLLIQNLGWGLVGAALVLDGSWWFIAMAQFLYIISGACGETWSGFSWKAFQNLWGFLKISVASALGSWACMVAIGLNVASSVRVSNELGSGHPRKARFSVLVIGVSSLLIGLFFTLILIVSRKRYPGIFTNSSEVEKIVEELTPLVGISMVFTNVQYALSGVAIGAGWQTPVAYMSTVCYFVFGIPSGALMAYKFKMGLQGIWYGMVLGLCLQTCLLLWMIWTTNWTKECYAAKERLRQWRGETLAEEAD